jgi:hypothetical protein
VTDEELTNVLRCNWSNLCGAVRMAFDMHHNAPQFTPTQYVTLLVYRGLENHGRAINSILSLVATQERRAKLRVANKKDRRKKIVRARK